MESSVFAVPGRMDDCIPAQEPSRKLPILTFSGPALHCRRLTCYARNALSADAKVNGNVSPLTSNTSIRIEILRGLEDQRWLAVPRWLAAPICESDKALVRCSATESLLCSMRHVLTDVQGITRTANIPGSDGQLYRWNGFGVNARDELDGVWISSGCGSSEHHSSSPALAAQT